MALSRFKRVSDENIEELLQDTESKSTQNVVKRSVNTFRNFLKENEFDITFETLDKMELNGRLRLFFASIKRQSKGDEDVPSMYKKNAYVSLRYGLAKFIKKEMEYDINDDAAFSTSKDVFQAMCNKMKKTGLGGTEHFPPISEEDLKNLYTGDNHAFNIDTPVGLQQKVWFEIVFYLCRRGRENIREMKKDTFKFKKDASGLLYIYQALDEADKNHSSGDNPNDTIGEGRMYEIPGNLACPVSSVKKYLEKLHPSCNDLWQRPLDSFEEEDDCWYYNRAMGKNTLGKLMKNISAAAKLSLIYTNHSIRATHITTLDSAGFEARHIMRTSGHKNESSIRSYSSRLTEKKKRDISSALAQYTAVTSNDHQNTENVPTPALSQVSEPTRMPPIFTQTAQHIRPTSVLLAAAPSLVNQQPLPCTPLNSPSAPSIPTTGIPQNGNWQNVLEVSDSELLNAENQLFGSTNISHSMGLNAFNFCPTLNNCNVSFNFSGPRFAGQF